MENLLFDPATGACLAGDFLDYKIPTAMEMPSEIESIFIESNEPTGPFGAKSLSEPCWSSGARTTYYPGKDPRCLGETLTLRRLKAEF
jgi:hypothetical protein